MIRRLLCVLVLAATAAAVGCGGGSPAGPDAGYVRHHEPSQGWTADVPAGWASVAFGPTFVRGDPLADPTRLTLATCRGCTAAQALRQVATREGVRVPAREGARAGGALAWRLYRGRDGGRPRLAVDLAVAESGADAQVAVLVSPRGERSQLVQTALLPALDSFVPGSPDPPHSVLADTPRDPSYWPTAGWRTASPASQGMDGARLDAMVAEIGAAKLPIDSVTVVRHGYVVLDRTFGRFASGGLGEPYASGRLARAAVGHEVGHLDGARRRPPGPGRERRHRGDARPAPRRGRRLRAARTDARKRAMTLGDLLTMQSGLAWREWRLRVCARQRQRRGGDGRDEGLVAIRHRPPDGRAAGHDLRLRQRRGAHRVGGDHRADGPPGRGRWPRSASSHPSASTSRWLLSPEGASAGGFGLRLSPRDLAKLAFLYLHRGRWDGRQIVPADWVEQSTTDHSVDPTYEYGYLWWLDRADAYAYMAGLYGQLAVVVPAKDLVVVITAHLPAAVDASTVTRWLLETYVLPAAR